MAKDAKTPDNIEKKTPKVKLAATSESAKQKTLIGGIFFLAMAFLGVVAIVYFLLNNLQEQAAHVASLQEQVTATTTEKSIVEQKATELEAAAGTSLRVDHLLAESKKLYPDSVKESLDGYLWVDRNADFWIVTLGILNGVKPGSRFSVFQGEDKVDTVEVQTPLDVISYVIPSKKLKSQFDKDYFRVVMDK